MQTNDTSEATESNLGPITNHAKDGTHAIWDKLVVPSKRFLI